ncbi:DUF411 domain-containing protein [Noviherbaspirillum suwonense]|uniref:Uncharacterized conserved protein n=1 Tax=Noviherbaspirillum suwonense TaxID=1224511 RepID=A0ABY1QUR2_9BURK|nr:DUF411 domain-containing protein [Noviherbaspirillum suwonense]SMP81439.1 Uncharacterized conserved protein [Noviherbaspirillum suwonense]
MNIWTKTLAAAVLAGLQLSAFAAGTPVKLYKNPHCGCCDVYADHLKQSGFEVEMIDTNDMQAIKAKFGVPEKLEGCHTATIGNYVFEGLIPAENIKKVLAEKPPIKGLSVPGMPVGAPGMPGNKKGPINVYYLNASATPKVFSTF